LTVLLGVDVGTGGARAVAVSDDGELIADASAGYDLLTPRPGWTEQRPEDWWEGTRRVLAEVARATAGQEIAGLGLTGQMHGSVFLDASDAVVRPALLWNDQRTERQCEAITERVGAEQDGQPAWWPWTAGTARILTGGLCFARCRPEPP